MNYMNNNLKNLNLWWERGGRNHKMLETFNIIYIQISTVVMKDITVLAASKFLFSTPKYRKSCLP